MYVSVNNYATINPGTAIIDSVSPAEEEIGDKDELLLPKLPAAELLIHIYSAAPCFPLPSPFIQVS